jgi:hypothetical protein
MYGDSTLVPIIDHNVIVSHANAPVILITGTKALITYNIIRYGGGNSVACQGNARPELHYNDIYGPFTNSGQEDINAEHNYWGTSSGDSILIIHYFNGVVNYIPFLAEPYNGPYLRLKDESTIFDRKKISIYPNPFLSCITIDGLDFKKTVCIYNSSGKLIRKYFISSRIVWDGKDDFGTEQAAGRYYIKVQDGNKVFVQSIIKLK